MLKMQNSQPQSLEKRQIRHYNNKWETVLAISEVWCSNREFPRYLALPALTGQMPLGAKDAWLNLTGFITEEFTWLLKLPHHCFWSQVIFDKSVMICLNSFLQEAPPVYCTDTYPKDVQVALDKLTNLVFFIVKRLVTLKESEEEFISPNILGEILYENYIFTVPSLLDICGLYGTSNRDEVVKLLDTITSVQQNYLEDFSAAVPPFIKVLEDATNKITEDSGSSKHVVEHISLVLDSLITMRIFCHIFPRGCRIFTCLPVVSAVATFYSTVMPNIAKRTNIKQLVSSLRVACLKFVNVLLKNVLEEAMESQDTRTVELYISLISEIMSEGLFICDYHAVFVLDNEFEIVANVCPELDPMKLDYLMEALASHKEIKMKKLNKPPQPINHKVNYPGPSNMQHAAAASTSKTDVMGEMELVLLVTQVQELLPHLGSKFIEQCLKFYDYKPERVINAVLESTLPPNLEEMEWTLERPSTVENSVSMREQINGYDDSKPGFKTKIFKGKKPREFKNANQMLSDKSELAGMKDKFISHGYVEDEYDDEYDDTYDSQDVAAKEPDAAAARPGRPFVVPRVLQTRQPIDEQEDNTEEEEDATAEPIKKDYFVPNPEEMRAKAEARRAQARGQRDVVGRTKGQGQDKQVLINRQNKNVNKSGMANHNRKNMGTKKRNQGIP